MQTKRLAEQMKRWIVNDYFTPNIKAEVVLDTLLTPYIAGIIKGQCGDKVGKLQFVTKEMSIFSPMKQEGNVPYGNTGAKIDYILAEPDGSNETPVYLAELKTTDSSLKKEQADRYIQSCGGKDKTFGTVFGDKLLHIAGGAFGETYRKAFMERFGEGPWDEQTLLEAFRLAFELEHIQKRFCCTTPDSRYADAALTLIRKAGWTQSGSARSRKYLYTMGQLLDHLFPDDEKRRRLWDKPLRLIYLTPRGSLPSSAFLEQPDFYLRPDADGAYSVSLLGAAAYLESLGEEIAGMLAEIIRAIYPV